ncbi:MAG: site-specific integrase [Armatimonadetes bacterium]|nr:site-specific integrase [Armatimonadota bacterium]
MRGHVRKHGKSWQWIVHVDGRQLSKSGFETKGEADSALAKVLVALDAGTYVNPAKMTVREFLVDIWLPSVAGTVKETTFESYRNLMNHVIEHVGTTKLQKLTPRHLTSMYSALQDNDKGKVYSSNTIRRIHSVLHHALKDAERWGLVGRNQSEFVRPPRLKKLREMQIWTPEQIRDFLGGIRAERLYAMWLTFATTGMRRGEVAGLRWADFHAERLEVRQILVPLEHGVITSEPKTAKSRRTVPLDSQTAAALREWRTRQGWERKKWSEAWTETGLIFTRENGKAYHPQSLTDAFLRLQAAHNEALRTKARETWTREGLPLDKWPEEEKRLPLLPRIRLHELRHSWATAALRAGINPKVVSERLGHATVAITLDTYSSVLPTMGEEAAAKVAALMVPRISG